MRPLQEGRRKVQEGRRKVQEGRRKVQEESTGGKYRRKVQEGRRQSAWDPKMPPILLSKPS
jgi:hypothetical protein